MTMIVVIMIPIASSHHLCGYIYMISVPSAIISIVGGIPCSCIKDDDDDDDMMMMMMIVVIMIFPLLPICAVITYI